MAKITASRHVLPNFTLLAPSIWESTPISVPVPTCSPSKHTDSPSLVVLCTWTGAQLRHIAKYTEEYRSLFPSARIMVITTTTKDLCFRNSRRKQERLKPAVDRISSYKYLDRDTIGGEILMHVFSEGGSNKACELAEIYSSLTSTRLPVTALCCDSTPGHPRFLRLCNALNKSLPSVPVLRHVGFFCGSAVLGGIWVLYVGIKGYENNVITKTRRRLQDPTHFDLTAPRCYLYSTDDALIASQDVHEHAEYATRIGVPVREVMFEGSGHVGHARHDPERYWDAVMDTWRITHKGEKTAPRIEVSIGSSDMIIGIPEMAEPNKRWSDADSQRTLLPGPGPSVYGTFV